MKRRGRQPGAQMGPRSQGPVERLKPFSYEQARFKTQVQIMQPKGTGVSPACHASCYAQKAGTVLRVKLYKEVEDSYSHP